MTAKQTLPLLVAVSAIVGGCEKLGPSATQEQMDRFGSDLLAADTVVLTDWGRVSLTLTLPEDESREVVAAFASDNLRPWGNYSESVAYGRIVFFAQDVQLASVSYFSGSVCERNGVYVILKRDPLKKYIQGQRTARH